MSREQDIQRIGRVVYFTREEIVNGTFRIGPSTLYYGIALSVGEDGKFQTVEPEHPIHATGNEVRETIAKLGEGYTEVALMKV